MAYIQDVRAWLRAQSSFIEAQGQYVPHDRPAVARVKPGSLVLVPANMHRTVERLAESNEIAVPMVMLQLDLRSVNQIDDAVLPNLLDQAEHAFVDMMNKGQGRLQLFYTDGWNYRNGVSHFLFSRIVGAVKELS